MPRCPPCRSAVVTITFGLYPIAICSSCSALDPRRPPAAGDQPDPRTHTLRLGLRTLAHGPQSLLARPAHHPHARASLRNRPAALEARHGDPLPARGFAVTATSRPRPMSWSPPQGRPTAPATSCWAPRPARPAAARPLGAVLLQRRPGRGRAARRCRGRPARRGRPRARPSGGRPRRPGSRGRPGDPAVPDRPRGPGRRSVVGDSGADLVDPGGGLLAQRPHQPARPGDPTRASWPGAPVSLPYPPIPLPDPSPGAGPAARAARPHNQSNGGEQRWPIPTRASSTPDLAR